MKLVKGAFILLVLSLAIFVFVYYFYSKGQISADWFSNGFYQKDISGGQSNNFTVAVKTAGNEPGINNQSDSKNIYYFIGAGAIVFAAILLRVWYWRKRSDHQSEKPLYH